MIAAAAGSDPKEEQKPMLRFREPKPEDAAAVWRLVVDSGVLDRNSPYAYLLVCSHFRRTSRVAEIAGKLVGFVAAYRPPTESEAVFVWQVGVDPGVRGRGLAGGLLEAVVSSEACRDVRYLLATVAPSNHASRALFESFARKRSVPCVQEPGFGAELFPESDHEPEPLLRIGPFSKEIP